MIVSRNDIYTNVTPHVIPWFDVFMQKLNLVVLFGTKLFAQGTASDSYDNFQSFKHLLRKLEFRMWLLYAIHDRPHEIKPWTNNSIELRDVCFYVSW